MTLIETARENHRYWCALALAFFEQARALTAIVESEPNPAIMSLAVAQRAMVQAQQKGAEGNAAWWERAYDNARLLTS